ncbi:unnamed protein product, partial [Owenia fusiformis]
DLQIMEKKKVLIFGHSLVHWQGKYYSSNLKLNSNEFIINFRGVRGANLFWKPSDNKRFQKKSMARYLCDAVKDTKPQIVYLQVGGNDLDRSFVSVEDAVVATLSLAEFLLAGYGVEKVCIGHAFHQRLKSKLPSYNIRARKYNALLTKKVTLLSNISAISNRGFALASQANYRKDGIHLSNFGISLWGRNLRRTIIFVRDTIL